jgi:hypothetical protein
VIFRLELAYYDFFTNIFLRFFLFFFNTLPLLHTLGDAAEFQCRYTSTLTILDVVTVLPGFSLNSFTAGH